MSARSARTGGRATPPRNAAAPERAAAAPAAERAGPTPGDEPALAAGAGTGAERGAASHLLVRCGEIFCALPLAAVRRVTGRLEAHPLPGARAELAGLAEFAGEPLPILDLARLVGAPAGAGGAAGATVVAWAGPESERALVGLAVDEALELVGVRPEATVTGAGGLLAGEVNLGGRAVRVLDLAGIG